MTTAAESASRLWPLLLYAALAIFVIAVMLGLSYVLGQRHREKETGTPFESGVPPTGPGRPRVNVRYYLVAVFFVVFDLESALIFAWAVAFRDLGWRGYAVLAAFTAILFILLFYEVRSGALDIVAGGRKRAPRTPASSAAGEPRS